MLNHSEYAKKLAAAIEATKQIFALENSTLSGYALKKAQSKASGFLKSFNSFSNFSQLERPEDFLTPAGEAININIDAYKAGKYQGFEFSRILFGKFQYFIEIEVDSPLHSAILGGGLTIETDGAMSHHPSNIFIFNAENTTFGKKYNGKIRAYLARNEELQKLFDEEKACEEETKRAQEIIEMLELPTLSGTPKQIAWAEKIRTKVAQSNDKDAKKSLKRAKTAEFWIDNFKNF